MSEMKATGNRLRIVMQPIAGWIDWKDSKPYRYKPENKPAKSFDAAKPVKPFWCCYVWDYEREGLFILEITQASVLKSITKIASDDDWGDFMEYDFKIMREGQGKETRYTVTPLPHKPISDKIKEAMKKSPVRLEALYEGGDPWTDLTHSKAIESTGEIELQAVIKEDSSSTSLGSSIEDLKKILEAEEIPTEHLESYVTALAERKGQLPIEVIGAALKPQLFPMFKNAYAKGLAKRPRQLESTPA